MPNNSTPAIPPAAGPRWTVPPLGPGSFAAIAGHFPLEPAGPVTPADGDQVEPVTVSCVIPLLNEEQSLRPLYDRLRDVLSAIGQPCEVIFVDDGSTDGSFAVLQQLHAEDCRVRVIRLRRSFGQAAALSAGFDWARGHIVVTLDADLQNDPADVPRLLDKIAEGYDVVSGWRIKRHDDYLTRQLPSRVANRLISLVTGVRLHDYGCSLKAYRREVLQHIHLYGEMHRFLPSLVSWMGVRMAEIPVGHAPRRFGRSKYTLRRAVRVLLDLMAVKFLLDYSTRPIQLFGLLGLASTTLGITVGAYLSALKLVFHQSIGDRPLLLLAVLLTITGVQLVTMGLLGELVIRNYHQVLGKPIYIVRELLRRDELA